MSIQEVAALLCPKTTRPDFPHHWKCIETNGHKDEQCLLADGSHRFPDGSIIAKDTLEKGGFCLVSHHIGVRENTIQLEVLEFPK